MRRHEFVCWATPAMPRSVFPARVPARLACFMTLAPPPILSCDLLSLPAFLCRLRQYHRSVCVSESSRLAYECHEWL
ncbi:hypothetical protein FIBSPDRAFT_501496 [Athelia psychrophila]|uniref:Uncharacterized protein n=1 Tax=Athelia psychrophila TaxID=1759441 RepID=A0A166KCP4_9AGAM|nr:hypothetical protein FIBSPDRAFT_501496 [Fibularhizoctonia sp. CBS 109695]